MGWVDRLTVADPGLLAHALNRHPSRRTRPPHRRAPHPSRCARRLESAEDPEPSSPAADPRAATLSPEGITYAAICRQRPKKSEHCGNHSLLPHPSTVKMLTTGRIPSRLSPSLSFKCDAHQLLVTAPTQSQPPSDNPELRFSALHSSAAPFRRSNVQTLNFFPF